MITTAATIDEIAAHVVAPMFELLGHPEDAGLFFEVAEQITTRDSAGRYQVTARYRDADELLVLAAQSI